MKLASIAPAFVEYVPRVLDHGTLYISITYRTAVHLCACGCGNKVATPIRPADWVLTYDGDTVSLAPSIGNWQLPCRSHYWIHNNNIRWSGRWSDTQIEAGKARDHQDRTRYYTSKTASEDRSGDGSSQAPPRRRSRFTRLHQWFRNDDPR